MADAAAKTTKLANFLAGADTAEFGGDNPLEQVAGGVVGFMTRLAGAESITLEMVPNGKTGLAAMKLGQLVARAGLDAEDLMALDSFVELGFEELAPRYNRAMQTALEVAKKASVSTATPEAKGTKSRAPSADEQARILREEGVPWDAIVAGACAVGLGFVPSLEGLAEIGPMGDPVDSDACTRRRKHGQLMALNYIKAKDAIGLFEMHMTAAKSLASRGYGMTASDVMVKCNALHRLTIAVGYNEGYLLYWKSELEDCKGKRITAKIDQETLTEVLMPRALKAGNAAMCGDLESQVGTLRAELSDSKRASREAIQALKAKISEPKPKGQDSEKKCWKCKGTGHMSWSKECPMYRDKDDTADDEALARELDAAEKSKTE